jgi:hypothetical protein
MVSDGESKITIEVIQSLREYGPIRTGRALTILEMMGVDARRFLDDPFAHWGQISSIAHESGLNTEQIPHVLGRARTLYKAGQTLRALHANPADLAAVFSADTFQREFWSLLRGLASRMGEQDLSHLLPELRMALERTLSTGDFYGAHQVLYLGGLVLGKDAVQYLTEMIGTEESPEHILLISGVAHALAMSGETGPLQRFVDRLEGDESFRAQERRIMTRYYQTVPSPLLGSYLSSRSMSFPYDQDPQAWNRFFATLARILASHDGNSCADATHAGKLLIYLSASVRREPEFNLRIAEQLRSSGMFEVTVPQEFTPAIPHEKLDPHFVAMCDVAMDRCDALLLLADVYGRDCASEVQRVHDLGKPVLAYLERDGYVAEDWMVIARFTRVLSPSHSACDRLQRTPILGGKVELIDRLERLPEAMVRFLRAPK